MVSGGEQDELRRLRQENARLKELLTQHGIAWEEPTIPEPVPAPTSTIPILDLGSVFTPTGL